MKKRNQKKKLKGFTLVECLVALCVFAISATVLVSVGDSLNQTLRNATYLQQKLCIQAPRAQARETDASVVTPEELALTGTGDKSKAAISFAFSGGVDASGVPISGGVAVVYADTYQAECATDNAKYKGGVTLNYMLFDEDYVAGAGGALH